MIRKILLSFFLLGLLIFINKNLSVADAAECDDKQDQDKVNCLQNKVNELQGQKRTLSSQIAVMDSQIDLAEARIDATKQQISELTLDIDTADKKIDGLAKSLDNLVKVLLNRMVTTYQIGQTQPFEILISSTNATNFFSRLNYLKIAQQHDKQLIYLTQQAKNDYTNQKNIYEDKKKKVVALKTQLESYTKQLEVSKKDKQALLIVTQSDEAKYQQLLSQALAERKAIVAAFSQAVSRLNSGEGESIGKGGFVALLGNSGSPNCSSGPHLHFTILQNGSPIDPAQKLKDVSPGWDNSPDGPVTFTGDWDWPISNPSITQGYGMTYWARLGWYSGNIHDGFDMTGSTTINAPKSGKVIYGSTTCSSSQLKYAAIRHDDDSSIITLYLHIQ